MDITRLKENLEKETITEKDGADLAVDIESLFNGSGCNAKAFYAEMSKNAQNRFLICAYLALFDAAKWWINSELNGWDERKRASAIFGYRNLDLLSKQYEELTGLQAMPECSDNRCGYYGVLVNGWNRKTIIDAGYEWILGFAGKWASAHSTLQQSFIRFAVNNILLVKYPDGTFIGNRVYDDGISFPYI